MKNQPDPYDLQELLMRLDETEGGELALGVGPDAVAVLYPPDPSPETLEAVTRHRGAIIAGFRGKIDLARWMITVELWRPLIDAADFAPMRMQIASRFLVEAHLAHVDPDEPETRAALEYLKTVVRDAASEL